ncbi:hypothetical protein TL16_g06380 [Triparma laevis f. inornata]|uniref:Uncharacterized protein n=1 Tax=Triparma laevis f. inornata TaxID=1714386 RepID=A0A9W7ARE3_9STRA|nr:hypothetical protein TL16_g06380 [Triparma laevis f. inornata]
MNCGSPNASKPNVTSCISTGNGHIWPGTVNKICNEASTSYSPYVCRQWLEVVGGTTFTLSGTNASIEFFDSLL